MTKPKIGVVGLGSIGARHLLNLQKLGYPAVGYDPVGSQPSEWNDILECDAVMIASPTKIHAAHIDEFNGIKMPMFVEKPIVATRYEWDRVPLSNILMVGYNLRFHSCTRKVRQWMGDGLIGKPLWARFTCAQYSAKAPYLRDGVILNWSHEIDLALHLLGGAVLSSCVGFRPSDGGGEESLADLVLTHKNRCQTVVHLDYLTHSERRGFVIVGDKGSIDADLVNRQAFCKDKNGKLIHSHFGRDSFDGNYVNEAQAFLALVENKVKPGNIIGCSAPEAMAVADICLKAKEFICAQ